MRRLPFLDRILSLRRLIRALERIADTNEQQTTLLARIADVIAPLRTEQPDDVVKASSSLTYSRDAEQARILAYVERTLQDTGREPTEDEILIFLDGRPQ